ncbi:UNVERIFIED_CONTAM: hypothetical protein K2H54_039236 [Gekko kuhli]
MAVASGVSLLLLPEGRLASRPGPSSPPPSVLFCCCLLRRPGNQEGQTQQQGRKPVVGRDKQTHKHYWAGRIGKPVVKIWEAGSLGTLQQRAAELEHVAEVLLTGEQLWLRSEEKPEYRLYRLIGGFPEEQLGDS